MARRRGRNRRSRRGRRMQAKRWTDVYTYAGHYASGDGTITLVPKNFGFEKSRTYVPIKCQLELSLRPDKDESVIISNEFCMLHLFNWFIQGQVIKTLGPFTINQTTRRITMHWPRLIPTEFGDTDLTARKLFSVFDYGVNSKLGLAIVAKMYVREGPRIVEKLGERLLKDLPLKLPLTSCSEREPRLPPYQEIDPFAPAAPVGDADSGSIDSAMSAYEALEQSPYGPI